MVRRVAFGPDGTHLVTGSDDRTARVWRADGTGEPVVLAGHEGNILSVAFSPEGTHVVTASDDGTARVWQTDGTGNPVVLTGHTSMVTSAAFSPDGTQVVTASWDGTARVWRADGTGDPIVLVGLRGVLGFLKGLLMRVLTGQRAEMVNSAAFSPVWLFA